MSEQTIETNNGFATEGYDSFPSLYADSKLISELAEWNGAMLSERIATYTQFLGRDDLMPRAKETAERTLDHMMFELAYRDGVYE